MKFTMFQESPDQCSNVNSENLVNVPVIQSKSEPAKKPTSRGYAGMKKGFLSENLLKKV